jgi:hypothetical protein
VAAAAAAAEYEAIVEKREEAEFRSLMARRGLTPRRPAVDSKEDLPPIRASGHNEMQKSMFLYIFN